MQKLQSYTNENYPDLTVTLWQDEQGFIVRSSLGAEVRFDSALAATTYADRMAQGMSVLAQGVVDSGAIECKPCKLLGE